jgi:hypothetical protein
VIGCDEYMPLPNGDDLESIVSAWQPLIQQFRNISLKFSKPFILTEVGYCAGNHCDASRHDSLRGQHSQAMHYEAVLTVIQENSNWFKVRRLFGVLKTTKKKK